MINYVSRNRRLTIGSFGLQAAWDRTGDPSRWIKSDGQPIILPLPHPHDFNDGHVSILFEFLYYHHTNLVPFRGDIGLIGLAVMVLLFPSPLVFRSFLLRDRAKILFLI
jgi:hypothetical protein